MERVKLRLCLACLTLAVLPYLAGLGLVGWLTVDEFCGESTDHTVTSPNGQFSVQIVTVGCDRPIIGAHTEVRLRAAGAAVSSPGETVFKFSEPPRKIGPSVTWTGEKHLVIERLCVGGCIHKAHREWRSIQISYRCLEDHNGKLLSPGLGEG